MNNYEYIIASLPLPGVDSLDAEAVIAFVRSQLSPADESVLDLVLGAFDREKLGREFYSAALKNRNPFVRGFVSYDMLLRNTKVEYLNKALDRPEGTDVLRFGEDDEDSGTDSEEKPAILAVLEQDDILGREKGLDRLLWDKADELTRMHLFDLDVILAVVVKVMITDRWNKLDPATGREMFRNLVQEIRNTR